MNDTIVWMTLQYEWHYSMNDTTVIMSKQLGVLCPVKQYTLLMTLRYELHHIMNDINVLITLQYEWVDTTVWMKLRYEWHYGMNGTTVWMTLRYEWHYSVNHLYQRMWLQEITSLFLVFPGSSVQFPWQPPYRHRAEWQQADSREDGRQKERNSAVTWPHGGEHGVWGKQPVSDVIAITIMLIMWRNLKSVWQWFILLSLSV